VHSTAGQLAASGALTKQDDTLAAALLMLLTRAEKGLS
jgi:hypothetical protein